MFQICRDIFDRDGLDDWQAGVRHVGVSGGRGKGGGGRGAGRPVVASEDIGTEKKTKTFRRLYRPGEGRTTRHRAARRGPRHAGVCTSFEQIKYPLCSRYAVTLSRATDWTTGRQGCDMRQYLAVWAMAAMVAGCGGPLGAPPESSARPVTRPDGTVVQPSGPGSLFAESDMRPIGIRRVHPTMPRGGDTGTAAGRDSVSPSV